MGDIKLKLIDTDNSMVVTRGKGEGVGKGCKGGPNIWWWEDALTVAGGHTMQYTDQVSQKCILETSVSYINQCHPNKFNKNKKYVCK